MSFNQKTFGPISSHGNSDLPNIWTYRTTDSSTDTIQADYFIKKINEIESGDFINLDASDGHFVGRFLNENGSVTVFLDVITSRSALEGYYVESARFSENSTQPGPAIDVLATVTLGAGGSDPEGIITVAANGQVTVNKSGPLMVKQTFQIAKKTNPGNVEVFFQAEASVDGGSTWIQLGTSVNRRIANGNTINVFFDMSPVFFTAGTIVRNRWAQSSVGGDPLNPTSGVDDSDLLFTSPSAALMTAGVQPAPSALAVFYKLEGYNYV